VKFLVDMPLPPALARWLAAKDTTPFTPMPWGLVRSTDREILTRARQEPRTVVTADLDYPSLLALTGAEGPSLILFRGGDWSEPDLTERMQQILQVMGEDEITRSIVCCRSHSGASPPLTDNLRAARQRCAVSFCRGVFDHRDTLLGDHHRRGVGVGPGITEVSTTRRPSSP
jgi:predicted nuclease of predicted toxin-antitoxin system